MKLKVKKDPVNLKNIFGYLNCEILIKFIILRMITDLLFLLHLKIIN
jgi:hypothetical protein